MSPQAGPTYVHSEITTLFNSGQYVTMSKAHVQCRWLTSGLAAPWRLVAAGARIIGSCFGAQILARALGGEVAKRKDGK
jgi:GMP synthase-like glutamine amidotransferase